MVTKSNATERLYRNGPYEDHPIPIILPIIQLVQTGVQKENKMSYL